MHLCPRAERIDRLAISLVQAYITTARNHCPSCAGNRFMSYWFGYSETGGSRYGATASRRRRDQGRREWAMANKARGARGALGVVLAVCTAVLVLGMSGTANAALFARSGINAATTGEYISGYGVACANWVPNNPQLDPNYGPIYDPDTGSYYRG